MRFASTANTTSSPRSSNSALLVLLLLTCSGCSSVPSRFLARALEESGQPIRRGEQLVQSPIRPAVGLSVLWAGHSTLLIQICDKVFITDPFFSNSVGLLSKRYTSLGIDPASITRLDYILISHLHFDHFSFGSLDELPRAATLIVPSGAMEYTPEFGFTATRFVRAWQPVEEDGVRITPVPVKHFGGRYGFDVTWSEQPTFTGYVIEYRGTVVFFAGDTGYDPELFREIGKRFSIDVALLPISPLEPREYMRPVHTDPADALQLFDDLGARLMIPIHYGTFFLGLEQSPTQARTQLEELIDERSLRDRVKILDIGEQVILKD